MKVTVTEAWDGKTVFEYIRRGLGLSRRLLIRLKTGGGILLNGNNVTVRTSLKCGDVLTLLTEDSDSDRSEGVQPSALPFSVVFENEDFLVCDKPAGMVTHPSHNHQGDSLGNALAYTFAQRGQPFVFRPVNRLDRDTTGLVLVAKNQAAAYALSRQLMAGRVEKTYRAVLCGSLRPAEGEITGYIRRKGESIIVRELHETGIESEFSRTRYAVLREANGYTLAEASPVTGRTHQLRVHFASRGCPILGDTLYGSPSPWIARQALHAFSLSFDDLNTGERLHFATPAPLPADMAQVCLLLFGESLNDV